MIDSIGNIQHVMDQQKQVDLILLDFSKASNTVPHQHMLTKLAYYGIQGDGSILGFYGIPNVLLLMENHQTL